MYHVLFSDFNNLCLLESHILLKESRARKACASVLRKLGLCLLRIHRLEFVFSPKQVNAIVLAKMTITVHVY